MEAVQDVQRLQAIPGDNIQEGPPPIRADELDLASHLLLQQAPVCSSPFLMLKVADLRQRMRRLIGL